MAFNNYLEDENDKPYFNLNSLAYYYDKMEGFAKAVEGSAKALNLTKEEVEKRITLYIEQNKNELDQRLADWDGKLETFDSSVETLLSEWVDDGTLSHVIDGSLIDQKIAPVTEELRTRVYSKETNKLRPLVTFYLDDGYQNDYDVVLPKSKALGIPLTICLFNNSSLVGTPAKLSELVNTHGWELHAHTATHADLNTLTLDQQREEMRLNKEFFKNKGYELDGICYPKGYTDANSLKAAREYFNVGMSSVPAINEPPIDTYYVSRDLTDVTSLATLKGKVDKIKADGKGWIVFYSHSNIFGSNPDVKNKFFDMMDYVAASGIETVTVKDAMKVYQNTLDIGDKVYGDSVFKVGADGTIESTSSPIVNKNYGLTVNSKSGLDFPVEKQTITSFKQNNPSDIPIAGGIGTLITDRMMDNETPRQNVASQTFYTLNGTVANRKWAAGTWTPWVTIGGLNLINSKVVTNDTPITDFPRFQVTKSAYIASDNTLLPEGGIGTLETSRLSGNDALNYQMWYPYNKNTLYKRVWTGSGWGAWAKFTPSFVTRTETFDFGSVPANSSSIQTVTVPGVGIRDGVSVSTYYGIAAGLIVTANVTAVDTVQIRVFNVTASPIALSRSFVITVTKE